MKQLLNLIEELFESLRYRYQIGLETSVKVSDFNFDCVNLIALQMPLDKIKLLWIIYKLF